MKRILSLILGFFSLLFIPGNLQAQSTPQKQLLIQFNPDLVHTREAGVNALKMLATAARINTSNIQYIDFIQYHLLTLTDPEVNAAEALLQLKRADTSHLILNSEVNAAVQAHLSPNDPGFSSQWALAGGSANIGALAAWDINHSAKNVPIAIIDSGIDPSNTDEIRDNLTYYYDFISNSPVEVDGYTHGTKVFGIIAAAGNNQHGIAGLAWEAQVMSLRVLDNDGNSTIAITLPAIDAAIQHHAKIINISWGASTAAPSSALEQALRQARDAGILVVCSAGNLGGDNDLDNRNYPSSYNLDNIIAVAASDNSDSLASFGSYGSNYGAHTVHLAAPGKHIYSLSRGSYEYGDGTSFAAPYVTATAALLWGLKPDLTYQQVKQLILDNVDVIAAFQGKTTTGGRLNVQKALQAARGVAPAAPTSSPTVTPPTSTTGDGQSPVVDGAQVTPTSAPPAPTPEPGSSGGSGGGCSLEATGSHANNVYYLIGLVIFIFIQSIPLSPCGRG
ncbi:MAG: S8 family serine peptidase [Deltaproteobacteria bacterium]|nr:S8 family serine peptidase [Deltaproteobacteria bacterium]